MLRMNKFSQISIGLFLTATAFIGCGGKNNSKTSNRANQNPICKAIMADYNAHKTLGGVLTISGNNNNSTITYDLSVTSGQSRVGLKAVINAQKKLTVTTVPANLAGVEKMFKQTKIFKEANRDPQEWNMMVSLLAGNGDIVIKGNLKDNKFSNITSKLGTQPEVREADITLDKKIKNVNDIFKAVLDIESD